MNTVINPGFADIAALAVAAIISVCSALSGCADIKKEQAAAPQQVIVANVIRRDVSVYIEAVASLDGYNNADIRARVKGFLRTQSYKEGSTVKSGQTLFTIESADYSAAVNVARANLTRARVAHEHNQVLLQRDQGLVNTGTLSQQELDNATANVADADGQVQVAEAQLRQAELNLSYTQVKSPINGVAGLALVRTGNLVGQDGPTLLTTVSQLDPIRVNFPMSEVDYTKYPERFSHLEQRDLSWARKQFAKLEAGGQADNGHLGVELILSDGTAYTHRGVIVTANRQVDPSTGTIQIQALLPNPNGFLRPGGYGQIRIKRRDIGHGVLVVPEKALITVQGTYSLGVVGPDNKVQMRRVEVGPSIQALRIIEKGVDKGEQVVVDGIQKISDGSLVVPQSAPTPSATVYSLSSASTVPSSTSVTK